MKTKKLHHNLRPSGEKTVRFTITGRRTEIQWLSSSNRRCRIRKLSGNEYLNRETGEVFEAHHITSREENLASIRKSLNRLRDLVETNVTNPEHCRWSTVSYAENVTDPARLAKDLTNLIKKLRRRFGAFEYITVAEPQARGAWHAHAILIFPGKAPFIANDDLRTIWGHGFVNVRSLSGVRDVGRYLVAHLSDLEYGDPGSPESDEANPSSSGIKTVEVELDDGQTATKRFIKGARLHLYPRQFHLYRCSSGIKRPVIERIPAAEAESRVSGMALMSESTVQLADDATGFRSILNRRTFKGSSGDPG